GRTALLRDVVHRHVRARGAAQGDGEHEAGRAGVALPDAASRDAHLRRIARAARVARAAAAARAVVGGATASAAPAGAQHETEEENGAARRPVNVPRAP